MYRTVIKPFDDLRLIDLYDVLKLREEVFVIEQNCIYQDIDDKDLNSIICYIKDESKKVISTLRIIPYKDYIVLGRICTKKQYRNKHISESLITDSIDYIKENFNIDKIVIEAQSYAVTYYQRFGFEKIDNEFLMDGIKHQKMILKLK